MRCLFSALSRGEQKTNKRKGENNVKGLNPVVYSQRQYQQDVIEFHPSIVNWVTVYI